MLKQNDAFWSDVATLRGAVSLRVLPNVLVFGALSALCYHLHAYWADMALEVGPVEILGGALGVLLVLRTNAGYDRWWEARKAWGGIVNDSRALLSGASAFCHAKADWHADLRRWTRLFPRVSLQSLRALPCDALIAGATSQGTVDAADPAIHWPTFVAQQIASLLDKAHAEGHLSGYALIGLEKTRVNLVQHIGVCERILSTPLPRVYVLKIRRFIAMYLLALPLALVDRVGMATPFLTMLVAYTVLGVDRIAHELQNPFSRQHLSHLPLDALCDKLAEEVHS
jgi:putative membrane protein